MSVRETLFGSVRTALAVLGLMVAGSNPAAAEIVITTADGVGADTYVGYTSDPNPDYANYGTTVRGGENQMIVWGNQLAPDWWFKGYVRFDLSPIAAPVTSAMLTVTTVSGQLPAGTTIWGMDQGGAGNENWDEASLTWNNSAAVLNDLTSPTGFLSGATLLGTFGNISNTVGGTGDFSGAALTSFLNADTDGQVTLMFASPNGYADMATKENTGLAPSTLTVTIPEPATLALLVTGVLGLLAYAWRERR